MKTSRPIRVRISPNAITKNYQLAKHSAKQSKAWAVIKANAYGHGQACAVEALRHLADGFALLECENAIALREAGVTQPILLLEGFFAESDVRAVVEYQMTSVIHCLEQLELLLKNAPVGVPLAIYLKLNTGMNRLGFDAADLAMAQSKLLAFPNISVSLMTHFAEADGQLGVAGQLAAFQAMTKAWQAPASLANSAAILRYPSTHADWIRPGIMLYGASPFADQSANELGLQTTMTLETKIIGIQQLKAGDRVGYGGTFTADKSMRVGIVACGYADGYPRHAPSGTPIAVSGKSTKTVGRVSMDMLACDLTDIPEAGIGAPVTLWGTGVGGQVSVDAVATAAGTIAYELFCAVAPRVKVEVEVQVEGI